jgi:1-acyl-sn-glycerol-3-phosphate acyltransferase
MTAASLARVPWRGIRFSMALLYDLWRYQREMRGVAPENQRSARARWLHRCCRRALPVLNMNVRVEGTVPQSGLIVANHLGYVDVLTFASVLPCVFLSKIEVADWPVFGPFARYSGTLFIDRARRQAVGEIAEQMRAVLAEELPLIIFPEGTSTSGDTVLPFKTSLFEPVSTLGCQVTAAAPSYSVPDGSAREEIHWWGKMTLVPHVLNFFSKQRIDASVRFGEPRPRSGDRKTIARELHDEVMSLRTSAVAT